MAGSAADEAVAVAVVAAATAVEAAIVFGHDEVGVDLWPRVGDLSDVFSSSLFESSSFCLENLH